MGYGGTADNAKHNKPPATRAKPPETPVAVMTHAQIRPTTSHYDQLPTALQDLFDQYMDQADTAGTGDSYHAAMTQAALTAGIAVPNSRDIARCSCWTDGCGCGAIFDTALPGAVVTAPNAPDGNLSALQCPDCGHDHPRPIED